MTAFDAVGLVGTALILATYAASVAGLADPRRAAALLGNCVGASLILASLWHDWNLSAAIVEGAWAVIAAVGLIRIAMRGRR